MSNAFPSFASRVGASAAGLAKEALFRPGPGAAVNELSSAASDAGKSIASSGSAGPSASSMSLQNSTPTYPSSSQDGCSNLAHGCFRSRSPSAKTMAANDDFAAFLSLQKPEHFDLHEREYRSSKPPSRHKGSSASLVERGTATPSTLASLTSEGLDNHGPDGGPQDGAAVVTLLTDPSFDFECSTDMIAEYGDGSQCERDSAKDLARRCSFDIVHAGNPLSLIPNFQRSSKEPQTDVLHDTSKSRAVRSDKVDTRVRTIEFNKDLKVQPWIDILTTYHDEVWGDALPLVEAARKEVNAIHNRKYDFSKDCPAIRRLAMLLGHI
ncbi:MAG: hypothetical protein Q9186_001018 [Xanthomendoza sp. 1 TL-2023]